MKSLFIFISLLSVPVTQTDFLQHNEKDFLEDSLTPYVNQHGSELDHRTIRDCHQQEHGLAPHELYLAQNSLNLSTPFIKINRFVRDVGASLYPRTVRGHYIVISNPLRTLSVLEPNQPGGCNLNIRQTVSETSKKNKCLLAVNAGYFDTKQGACLGNVISDDRLAHDSKGIQNVHFGLTKDGQIFIGYLSHEEVLAGNLKQLVGGVVWILRNGTGFVNISKNLECEKTEETGPMDRFVKVRSARTAVGHDRDGNVIIIQIDGKTDVDGVNLFEMETLLQSFSVVNAINLDGGGSSTLIVNGVTANYPYDRCDDSTFNCDRKVSTILCVHAPYCDPLDCNQHGSCVEGECVCESNWLPPKCEQLFCGQYNCSNNGICVPEGCICHPGFHGKDCNETCPEGWYGSMCSKQCECLNAFGCEPVSGSCLCHKGFTGKMCQQPCPEGFYGENCDTKCECKGFCFCDPVTGSCIVHHNTSLYKTAKCLAENIIKDQKLVKSNPEEKRKWYLTMVILGVVTSLCLASFLIILCCSCSCYCKNEQVLCFKRVKKQYKKYHLKMPSGYISDSMSDSETFPMERLQRT